MKHVLYLTNCASPYRVAFFDELGRYCDVTVLLSEKNEAMKERDASWFAKGNGTAKFVQLEKNVMTLHGDALCTDVIPWLKKPFDVIVVCGYSSPTAMLAIAYLNLKRIPFYMEVDGGLIRQDSKPALLLKKWLVSRPTYWLSTGAYTTDFLVHYGAKREKTFVYPFSSLNEADILPVLPSENEKQALREKLGIREKNMVLTVGQFIPRKGFDVLLNSASALVPDTGIYFVGGVPTEEYLSLQKEKNLTNVHFVGFQSKAALAEYYRAADVYAMPTREDIWGLVVNEAMAAGLPVVVTDRCVAGLELIKDGVNGYIIPAEDEKGLAEKLNAVLDSDRKKMGQAALEAIHPYTIEKMAKVHADIFG